MCSSVNVGQRIYTGDHASDANNNVIVSRTASTIKVTKVQPNTMHQVSQLNHPIEQARVLDTPPNVNPQDQPTPDQPKKKRGRPPKSQGPSPVVCGIASHRFGVEALSNITNVNDVEDRNISSHRHGPSVAIQKPSEGRHYLENAQI